MLRRVIQKENYEGQRSPYNNEMNGTDDMDEMDVMDVMSPFRILEWPEALTLGLLTGGPGHPVAGGREVHLGQEDERREGQAGTLELEVRFLMKTVIDTSSKSSSGKISHVLKMFLSSIAAVGSSMSLFTTVF